MKEIKFKLPIDADHVSIKIEDGCAVVTYEPKIFQFGDYVEAEIEGRNKKELGIFDSFDEDGDARVFLIKYLNIYHYFPFHAIEHASYERGLEIDKFLSDNNLIIDRDNKKIIKKRWRAEKLEDYFIINGLSDIERVTQTDDEFDFDYYSSGNYFRTKEQAEKVAKEIREIFEKHKND